MPNSNRWRDSLASLELLIGRAEMSENNRTEMLQLFQTLKDRLADLVDVTEFCRYYRQSLCICDGTGRILYMNAQYMRDVHLTEEALGQKEPFQDPISARVIQERKAVSFGNDGSRMGLTNGRFVSGVPIFDEEGNICRIVITLSPDYEVYRRYRELQQMMNRREAIQIINSDDTDVLKSFLGKNAAIKEIRSKIRKVAPTDATVLITGESGAGKEVIADNIYEFSNRKNKPYVKINCAAIPANLLEAELFGYEKGAFTGATSRKIGLFERADQGTILLDEIGDFPRELQPKLLRVLQQQELYRIGSSIPVKINVRIIAATNADLRAKMKDGSFREDLFYRINVFPIRVPPLRERRDDVRGLLYHFLYMYSQKYDRTAHLSDEICDLLENYDWPGNVREMQNVMEYYVICCADGGEPDAQQLMSVLQIDQQISPLPPVLPMESVDVARQMDQAAHRTLLSGGEVTDEELPEGTLFELRDSFEKQLIERTLRKTTSVREAAQILGLYPSSLYRKIQKYGITPPGED